MRKKSRRSARSKTVCRTLSLSSETSMIGQAQIPSGKQRSEPRPTFTVSVDWRGARQVRCIRAAADCHLFLLLRGRECVAASANPEVNQNRGSNKDRRIGTHEHDAEHHG